MAFEKRELTGALFPNDKKGNAKAPDWRGYVIVNGIEYELSGWAKISQRGEFISMAAKIKEERRDAPQSISERAMPKARSAEMRQTREELNDEVPF